MDVNFPARAVVPSAHGPVLAVLARAGVPLTGRRIAELTHPPVSQKQVATVLAALTEHGLVHATSAGRANLYVLNRDHLAADAVLQLVSMRERLWRRIEEHVATWQHVPEVLAVYGSTARGDGGVGSDIDVLVVRPEQVLPQDPAWQGDLDRLVNDLTDWTGNSVDLLELTHTDLVAMARAGEALLDRIRDEGRFVVGGRSDVPTPRAA